MMVIARIRYARINNSAYLTAPLFSWEKLFHLTFKLITAFLFF